MISKIVWEFDYPSNYGTEEFLNVIICALFNFELEKAGICGSAVYYNNKPVTHWK